MENKKSNLASSTDDLWVEVFEDFVDLPAFEFDGTEPIIHSSDDLTVTFQKAGKYIVYKVVYSLLPADHPERFNYLIYDSVELEENRRKVFKFFTRYMDEITLGEATYDIGILFSGGRVFSETHFIEQKYKV
ncbi:MAG: hypothetical protein ACPGJS_21060 [Flammeovirgaceae bacterium]